MSPPSPSTMDNMGIHHSSISPPSLHASLSSHHQSGPRSSHGMHLHGSNDFKSHYSANTDPLLSGATRYDTPSVLMTSRSYDSINPHDLSSLSGSVGGVGSSSNPGGDLYSGAPHFLLPSTDSANVNGLTDGINHNSQVHPSLQQQTDYSQRSSWPASGSSGLKSNYTSAPATAYYVDINNAHNLTSAYTIPAGPSSIPRLTSSAASSASSAAAAMGTLPTATTMDNYSIFPALSILSSSLPTNDISQHAQKSLPPLPGMPPKPDYNSPSPNSGYGRVFNTTDAYRSTYATTSVTPISTDAMGVSCTSGVTSASMATSSNTTVSQTGPSPSISRTPSRMGTTNGSGSGGGYIAASGGLMSVSTVTGSSGEYGYLSHQGQEVGRDNGAGQGSGTPRRVLTPLSDMAGSRSTHENDASPGGRCSLDERRRTKGH